MTDAALQRLRELADAATPGNWHATDCISPQIVLYAVPVDKAARREVRDHDVLYLGRTYADGDGHGRANMKFIAAARSAVPALLDEVAKLRGLVTRWEALGERHNLALREHGCQCQHEIGDSPCPIREHCAECDALGHDCLDSIHPRAAAGLADKEVAK